MQGMGMFNPFSSGGTSSSSGTGGTVDLSNYYDKTEVDNIINNNKYDDTTIKTSIVNNTTNITNLTTTKQDKLKAGDNITISNDNVISADLSNYYSKTDIDDSLNKTNVNITALTEQVKVNTNNIINKQNKLTAGDGIDITDNVIKSTVTDTNTTYTLSQENGSLQTTFTDVGGDSTLSQSDLSGQIADTVISLKDNDDNTISQVESIGLPGTGYCSAVINANFNKATGRFSYAEGRTTTASAPEAHAEGQFSTASGSQSHAEGNSTTASGTAAHSEGTNTGASGNYSHAEGSYTKAQGIYSHAEGSSTTALGDGSHAEGVLSVASGAYSHAGGWGTNASGENQTVIGKYNVVDADNTYAFIIGNGTDSNNRSNLFAIRWDGTIDVKSTNINLTNLTPTYDSELNSTSENAVQNKTLYSIIGDINTILDKLVTA